MSRKLYLVTGISGSGKTTTARHLQQRGEVALDSKLNHGLYHFADSNGKTTDSVHLQDEVWRKQYKWLLNEEMLEKLLEEHEDAQRVYLCGRANLFQYWDKADKVFLLKVDAPTLLNRLNNETRDNQFAKDAATQNQLLGSLNSVQDKITQLGATVIDAVMPIKDVVDQILEESD